MYKVIVSSFAEKLHALDPFHLSINRKIIIFNIKIHKACFFGSPKANPLKFHVQVVFNTKKFTNKKLKYNCAPLSRGPYVTNFNWTNIIILYFFKNLLKSQRKIEKN